MSNRPTGTDPFLAGLTILFIALKLTGTIEWSWWWVLAPIWIPTLIVLSVIAVAIALPGRR